MNINTHLIPQENVTKHSLNNIDESLLQLKLRLDNEPMFANQFSLNYTLENYNFDFYSSEFKFAIQIDAYSYAYSDIYNVEKIKVLSIPYKNITVLKVSDYQILVDSDEIIRFLKNHIKLASALQRQVILA